MFAIRKPLRHWRTALVTIAALLLLFISVGRGDHVSDLKATVGAHHQDLVRWEITHFMDKWFAKAVDAILAKSQNQEERLAEVELFFALGKKLRDANDALENELAASLTATKVLGHTSTSSHTESSVEPVASIISTIDEIKNKRRILQPNVEETLESAISEIVTDLGITDSFGPVDWPPVDFTFEDRGLLLVRSPRDAIVRLNDILLDPGIPVLEQVQLEENVENLDESISALIVRVGGIATYPAQISPERTLHGTLEIAAHEWLHHWLIFRPLGRRWGDGGELQSINETLANLFAQEVGDLSLKHLTGDVVTRVPWTLPLSPKHKEPSADVFDFSREMRLTRFNLERLLEERSTDIAEAYLEERRLEFVDNGFNIRKLNNAWFAFNGTYADSPGSISPIEPQLRIIRAASPDLVTFLKSIAVITEPGELEAMAVTAGWVRP